MAEDPARLLRGVNVLCVAAARAASATGQTLRAKVRTCVLLFHCLVVNARGILVRGPCAPACWWYCLIGAKHSAIMKGAHRQVLFLLLAEVWRRQGVGGAHAAFVCACLWLMFSLYAICAAYFLARSTFVRL